MELLPQGVILERNVNCDVSAFTFLESSALRKGEIYPISLALWYTVFRQTTVHLFSYEIWCQVGICASAYYFKAYYWGSFHFWHMIERLLRRHANCTFSYLFSCTEIPCNEIGKSLALKVVKWFECKYIRWRLFKPSKAPASMAEIRFSERSNLVKVSNPWKARVRIASILLARRLRLIKDSEAPPSWLFSASEGTCGR